MNIYGLKINQLSDLNFLERIVRVNKFEKPNFSNIARNLGVHRDTVRKHYNEFEKSNTRNKVSRVEKHRELIESLLKNENKSFDYKSHLYRYIKRNIMDVDYAESTFRSYINKEFNSEFRDNKKDLTIRYETKPGEQAQFDYKENQTIIDQHVNKLKYNIATLTFSYSRKTYCKIISDKTCNTLIMFLSKTFQEIKGCPKQIVFDNGSSIVSKPRSKDSPGEINYKLKQMLDDYGIDGYICMSYRPQTKGKVETQMKVMDELKGYGGDVKDYIHLDEILQTIISDKNLRISQATNLPPELLWTKEKEHIKPLPRDCICSQYFALLSTVMANKQSLISYKSNKYSVPPKYIGLPIGRQIINNKLHLYYNENYLCSHMISDKKINYDNIHKQELIKLAYKVSSNTGENIAQLDENTKVLERIEYD